ncbi:MAG: hypothetical protein RLZZ241_611, partial [Bacteroidota bacterium]
DVYLTYDEQHLLIGFIAYADMSTLRSSIRNRDAAWQDDMVMIGIDTYKDGRYAISMGSNPEGNQLDFKVNSGGNDDVSYDVTFYTKASKHENAYHVEMMIPFSVLQFEQKPEMTWNVLFYRSTYTGDKRSQNFNFPLDRDNPCLVCQIPTSISLKGIKSKNRVTLLPNVFSGLTGKLNENSMDYSKLKANFGLSGLFDINNSTSLEYAINPDFSQVEADVSQITINNTFGVVYPERRPYFNEGKDILDFNLINTVYTRSINNPLISAKLINQGAKQRYYWLTAYDQDSPYLVAGENESYIGQGDGSFANVFRYQRTYEGGSNIGLLTTNRFFNNGGSGNTLGVDGIIRIKKQYSIGFGFNGSNVVEPESDWITSSNTIKGKTVALDGETNSGFAGFVFVNRSSKNWNSNAYYVEKSPWYNTPLGFVTKNNFKTFAFGQGYQGFFKEESVFNRLSANLNYELTHNYQGVLKGSILSTQAYVALDGNFGTEIEHTHKFNEEFYGFNARNMQTTSVFMRYNPNENFNLSGFVEKGTSLYYDAANPEIGKSLSIGSFNDFQISPKLRISPSLRYARLQDFNTNKDYYQGYILRTNLNFQFNSEISLRVVNEMNNFSDTMFFQTLLKYNPNPFTIFFIGGTNGFSFIDNTTSYRVDNVQVYFKFQYMFDL